MRPEHEAILFLLNLEKHMPTKLIAQALYPEEAEATRYGRVVKQLQRLRTLGLLESRRYARLDVNDKSIDALWGLTPAGREYGYSPVKKWPSKLKYEHERTCAEVFVRFIQTELHGWEQHKKIEGTGIIPDRTAWLTETLPLYIEVELQDRDRVSEKLTAYQRYFRESGNQFRVLFLVKQLRDWRASQHYQFQEVSHFLSQPLSKTPSLQR